jgi:hypothetical protein
MLAFLTALTLSFLTLCLGTYVADRVETRSAACVHSERDARQIS